MFQHGYRSLLFISFHIPRISSRADENREAMAEALQIELN